MDDDLGREGHVEVGRLLCVCERLLAKHECTVHVPPGQQQVLDPQLDSLLPILLPADVVQVGALFLNAWAVRGK